MATKSAPAPCHAACDHARAEPVQIESRRLGRLYGHGDPPGRPRLNMHAYTQLGPHSTLLSQPDDLTADAQATKAMRRAGCLLVIQIRQLSPFEPTQPSERPCRP